MNVTARIESTGQPSRIQISRATAELLIESDLMHWISRREDKINAKGKGEIETFWVTEGSPDDGSTSEVLSPHHGDAEDTYRTDCLVDWNVHTFLQLLKQIVARRDPKGTPSSGVRMSKSLIKSRPKPVLEEVKEIISLPEFDASKARQNDPTDIRIPKKIERQLREFIVCIASHYRDNSFHNFKHASRVTMAVIKLLSRIVAASVEFDDNVGGDRVAATLHDHTCGITSDPLTQFACAFAALVHDVDHLGVPNAQLVKENNPIAALYGGRSVAEQNSFNISCCNQDSLS